MNSPEIMDHLLNFGVAGLMGVLWTWERAMSRLRERQLSEAHERLLYQQAEIRVLTDLVERNTRAFERSEQTQAAVRTLLESWIGQQKRDAA